jgi:hypothetical protein
MSRSEIVKKLKIYFDDNRQDLLDVCRQINAYDGSMDFCDTYDICEIGDIMKSEDLVMAIIYGDVENAIDPVRFDDLGHLESVDEYDLADEAMDYINEATDVLVSNRDEYGITVSGEVEDILNDVEG